MSNIISSTMNKKKYIYFFLPLIDFFHFQILQYFLKSSNTIVINWKKNASGSYCVQSLSEENICSVVPSNSENQERKSVSPCKNVRSLGWFQYNIQISLLKRSCRSYQWLVEMDSWRSFPPLPHHSPTIII